MVDWKNPPKLFIPGPVHVLPEVLQQLARPTMGHRNKEYAQLHNETIALLKQILFTEQNVFLVTSSASGLWEGCIRNCVQKDETVLACMCGAFSDKWASVVKSCGRNVDQLKAEWGKANTVESIDKALSTGKYAAITLVYSETSTGLANPVYEISDMMKKKYPNVLVFVDSVSGMVGMPIHFDKLGWDVTFASVQKAFAIPPGFTVAAVSKRAIEKAKNVPERGYYFDFVDFAKNNEKDNTPTTPSIPHIAAVNYQAGRLVKEGMENVWKRHKDMGDYCRAWAKKHFALFCEEKYCTNTLTTIANTKGIDVSALNKALQAKHNLIISNGYGDLKDKTFRIAHMGDITMADLKQVLGWIEEELKLS
jgi:aspartate aminotransferase-like enzyme